MNPSVLLPGYGDYEMHAGQHTPFEWLQEDRAH